MPKPKGPRPKHTPQRTCIICRAEHSKRELVRIVRLSAGAGDAETSANGTASNRHVQVDPTGKLAGRGAYLCRAGECWNNAALIQKLSAALKTPLTAEDIAILRAFRATLDD